MKESYPPYGGAGQTGQALNAFQVGASNSTAPPAQMLEQLDKGVDYSLSRLQDLTLRLKHVADRLFGSQPEAVADSNKSQQSSAVVARLEQGIGHMEAMTSQAFIQLERLERL